MAYPEFRLNRGNLDDLCWDCFRINFLIGLIHSTALRIVLIWFLFGIVLQWYKYIYVGISK